MLLHLHMYFTYVIMCRFFDILSAKSRNGLLDLIFEVNAVNNSVQN